MPIVRATLTRLFQLVPTTGSQAFIRKSAGPLLTISWATPMVIGICVVAALAALKADSAKVPFIYSSAR